MPGSIRNSESDMDEESQGAGRGGAKKRKGSGGGGGNGDESLASKGRRMEEDEFKVLMKFNEDISKHDISNPMRLTKLIKEAVGEVVSARYISNNRIIVFCKSSQQKQKALSLSKLGKEDVECVEVGVRDGTKGVITGVPMNISEEVMKTCMEGGTLVKATRFHTTKEGKKVPSTTILLQFSELQLPKRVMIGYVCYPVRPYVPAPLRCFKCQRLGHVAAVCRGARRCCRCGGDHDYGQCGEGVQPRCCNCGGAHSAAFQGCVKQQEEQEVQKYRAVNQVSYAEAVKQVKAKEPATNQRVNQKEASMQGEVQGRGDSPVRVDTMQVAKTDFLAFIIKVINCSAQATTRTDRIKIIMQAAKTHLDMASVPVEEVMKKLSEGNVESSQPEG